MGAREKSFTAGTAELLVAAFFEILFIAFAIQSYLVGNTTRSLWCIVYIILTLIPFAFERHYRVTFPFGLKMMVAFAFFVHLWGRMTLWYWEMPLYDKFAHAVAAVAVGLIIFSCYLYLDHLEFVKKRPFFKKQVRILSSQKTDVLVGTAIILILMGLFWEIGEYAIDVVHGTTYNFGLVDSVTDFMGNLIGLFIVLYIVNRSIDSIPPGEHLDYLLCKNP
jgi:hypothetical protein